MYSRRPALTWIVPLLLFQLACGERPGQTLERVEFMEVSHVVGTNLPRWAACWFPHRANPAAVRRPQPCPAEAAATTVYTAHDVQGCWLLTGDEGKPPYDLRIFSGLVRLEVEPSAKLRAGGSADAGKYEVQPVVPIPDSMANDTIGFVTYWEFVPPDSVSIIQSMDLAGTHMSFRVRGDSLIGMEAGFGDLIQTSIDTTPDPVTAVRGRRVACPPVDARDRA